MTDPEILSIGNINLEDFICSRPVHVSFDTPSIGFTGTIPSVRRPTGPDRTVRFALVCPSCTESVTRRILQKTAVFGDVMSKIEFEQNWRYGYVLYYGFGSK